MRKKILTSSLCAGAMIIIGIIGCKKPSMTKEDRSGLLKKISSTVEMTCAVPEVEDGMLVFSTEDHFFCFQDYLSDVMSSEEELDEDELLASVEASLGLSSLRAQAFDIFEAQNAIGWETYEAIPEEHWIHSKTLRSVLNTNREVKMGNHILRFISQEFVATVNADHPEYLVALEALPDNPTLEQIIMLDPSRENISVSSQINFDRVFGTKEFADGFGIKGTPIPLGDYSLAGTIYEGSTCNKAGYAFFEGFTLSHTGTPQRAFYRIELNDGFGTVLEQELAPGQVILPLKEANYGAGTFYPVVKVRSISPVSSGTSWAIEQTYTFTTEGLAGNCSKNARGSLTDYVINSSNVLRGKIDYYCWNTFPLSYPRTSISGWTELHHIDGNGNWNRRKDKKTTLCVKLFEADLRDDDCLSAMSPAPYEYECDKNLNQKSKEKRMGEKALRKFTGRHEVGTTDGVSGGFEHSLKTCD